MRKPSELVTQLLATVFGTRLAGAADQAKTFMEARRSAPVPITFASNRLRHTTFASPLTRPRQPQPCSADSDGAAFRLAEQRKPATYPELALGPATPHRARGRIGRLLERWRPGSGTRPRACSCVPSPQLYGANMREHLVRRPRPPALPMPRHWSSTRLPLRADG